MKLKQTKKQIDKPGKFNGRFSEDGGLDFGTYTKIHLKKFIKENPGMPFELKPLLPESVNQRKFFEGAICPLLTLFQEGMDYRNSKDVETVRDWLKIEFNGKLVNIGGKIHKIAQSTSHKLNSGFLERVIGYIQDNYGVSDDVLNPDMYKDWKDRIYPYGGSDTYIGYLLELNLIKKP